MGKNDKYSQKIFDFLPFALVQALVNQVIRLRQWNNRHRFVQRLVNHSTFEVARVRTRICLCISQQNLSRFSPETGRQQNECTAKLLRIGKPEYKLPHTGKLE